MKLFFKRYSLYIYISAIFLISLIPSDNVRAIHIFGVDKIFHLIEYLILGVIFKYSIIKKDKISYLLILFVPILDEFGIQRLSGRTIDHWDFIFNIIGLYLGIMIKDYFDKRTQY